MGMKKIDLKNVAAETGKSAAGFLEKAKDTVIKAVDQNDDGTFNREDIAAITNTIGTAAKKTAAAVKDSAEARNREMELKTFQPIFIENLDESDFVLPKLIRITEMDKKRAESDVCQNSIGYYSEQKELKIVNVFRKQIEMFGIALYPDSESEIYYVDPCDRDRYIALGDYFNYLKVARINELQCIAQALGAKHFRVTYKEQISSSTNQSVSVHGKNTGKAAVNLSADGEHNRVANETSIVEIAAEMDCAGHDPVEPTLHYLQREPSIQSLITLRMNPLSPITHQKYSLNLSNTTGMKEKDAMKIDAALKAMKITGNGNVASEVRNEARRYLEYEIDF